MINFINRLVTRGSVAPRVRILDPMDAVDPQIRRSAGPWLRIVPVESLESFEVHRSCGMLEKGRTINDLTRLID